MPAEKSQVSLFSTTRWSIVGDAGAGGDSLARDGFRVCWPPLDRYVRR